MMEQMLNFFISNAYAEALPAQGNPQGSGFSFIFMFMVLIVFIYFVILRPQNKRAKEQQNLLNSLAKGDEVVTAGGILGRIIKVTDRYVTIEIANSTEIIMQKSSVVNILPKGTLKAME